MRIYLGGHLNFYHPLKESWLDIELDHPRLLWDVLESAGIPLGEVHMVVVNGEIANLQDVIVSSQDEVKTFSAVGGG
jgi:sulfur carrier protein ThiS